MRQFKGIIRKLYLERKMFSITMRLQKQAIVFFFLQAPDQKNYNGKCLENQVVGHLGLAGQMFGTQAKKIADYRNI